jgi:hypothetical protein
MSLDTVTGIRIDAGIVTYEITDVNFSFGVLERAVLFEDIQLLLFQLSFEKIGQF